VFSSILPREAPRDGLVLGQWRVGGLACLQPACKLIVGQPLVDDVQGDGLVLAVVRRRKGPQPAVRIGELGESPHEQAFLLGDVGIHAGDITQQFGDR